MNIVGLREKKKKETERTGKILLNQLLAISKDTSSSYSKKWKKKKNTVQILYRYYTDTVPILYRYCTYTVPILYQ